MGSVYEQMNPSQCCVVGSADEFLIVVDFDRHNMNQEIFVCVMRYERGGR